MMTLSPITNTKLIKSWEVYFLAIFCLILNLIFVFDGFATVDSIRYAICLKKILNITPTELSKLFNYELAFGYYLFILLLIKLNIFNFSLSTIMNYTNCLFSLILIITLFSLFKSLTNDRYQALFASLLTFLSPSLMFLSLYGNPNLPAIVFFVISLATFDQLLSNSRFSLFYSAVFVLTLIVALTFRFDILLSFGAYFALLYIRGYFNRSGVLTAIASLVFCLFCYGVFRYLILGNFFELGGGTIAKHFSTRLEIEFVVKNIIKNLIKWAMAANPLVFILAGVSLKHLGLKKSYGILLIFWTLPWIIFLPFRAMDIARIISPTIPVFCFVAASYITFITSKQKYAITMFGFIILSQLTLTMLYYPMKAIYPFKKEINGRYLTSFPIGFPLSDLYYRQRLIKSYEKTADAVSKERDADVLIFADDYMYYFYSLYEQPEIKCEKTFYCNNIILQKCSSPSNSFYLFDINHNWKINHPIRRTIICLKQRSSKFKVHFMPYWSEFPTKPEELFLSKRSLESLLTREESVLKTRKAMIHK